MKSKSVFVALSVIGAVVLGNGATANAQTNQPETKQEAPAKKVVVVKAGDTLGAIATANGTTYVRLFNANESIVHPDVIDVGDEITIPTADEELPDRFSQLAPVVAPVAVVASAATAPVSAPVSAASATRQSTSAPVVSSSRYVGNGMWCTDYVHSRRPDVPIYGHAGYSWISAAQAQGKATGTVPRAGAVAVMAGHVAYVESVNADGSYVVSEMGWNYQAGNYNIRTVQPGTFGGFIY